jgi:pimeloyl-ACP methyl ester carboxylesterase
MTTDEAIGRTTSCNGIELHYEARGAGEPLLLLHGFTGCGRDFGHLFDLNELARAHRVIVPDLRGHGRSTNPAGVFTHRQCAQDVFALMDELGIDRFKAIGTSLGGNTLLHMATQQPDRVEAMVLFGAPSYFPAEARAIMAAFTEEARTPEEWQVMRARHAHGDAQIRALWAHARGFATSHDDMTFTPPHLATIRARTLVVCGDRDPLYPVEIFVEQHRAIPRSSLWVVPDGGHDCIWTTEREEFARRALAFLGQ